MSLGRQPVFEEPADVGHFPCQSDPQAHGRKNLVPLHVALFIQQTATGYAVASTRAKKSPLPRVNCRNIPVTMRNRPGWPASSVAAE